MDARLGKRVLRKSAEGYGELMPPVPLAQPTNSGTKRLLAEQPPLLLVAFQCLLERSGGVIGSRCRKLFILACSTRHRPGRRLVVEVDR